MRCKLPLLALTMFLALSGGCRQRCYLTEEDHNRTQTSILNGMEAKPDLAYKPLIPTVDAPPTLNDLDRKVRFLSLIEAISIALEQGTIGSPGLNGQANDNLV